MGTGGDQVEGDDVRACFDDALEVRMRVTRRADEPFIRLDGTIRNRRPDHRLRLHVVLPHPTTTSSAGSPFELVERPLVSEGSDLETASPTWPARGIAMAADTAVMHEGVFEYEVVEGRAIAVTLLRCVGTISRERMATRPLPGRPRRPDTARADDRRDRVPNRHLAERQRPAAPPQLGTVRAAVGPHRPPAAAPFRERIAAEECPARRRCRTFAARTESSRFGSGTRGPTAAVHATVGGNDVVLGPTQIETTEVTT